MRGLEDVPLLKLYLVLLVHLPGAGKERVPVVDFAVLVLYELDGVSQNLSRIRVRARLVVYHRKRHGEVRQAYAAALEHARGLTGVAGHIRGEQGLADNREVVVERDARLGRAARTHVGRKSEGLGHVYVEGLQLLVYVADDELRQSLQRYRYEIREAAHEERRQYFVHRHHAVRERPAAEAFVIGEDKGYLLRQALHYGVHVHVRYAQFRAAKAFEEAVYEGEGAQV